MKQLLNLLIILAIGYSLSAQPANCTLLYKVNGKESAYPRLSKDERSILYQSNASGKWQLYIMDIKSRHQALRSDGTANDFFPDWSADNKWIAFVSDRDGNEELYLMQADGSHLRRLTNDPGRDIHPYFSPDGRYLLFSSTRGNGSLDIYRYTLATGKIDQLTNTEDYEETCARYAPDMKHIVFLKNNASSDDIFSLNLTTSVITNLTRSPVYQHGWPMYSADGKWIYYSSMIDGSYNIYRIKPDGSSRTQITWAQKGEEDARVYVSLTGRLMIYNKRVGETIEIRQCTL